MADKKKEAALKKALEKVKQATSELDEKKKTPVGDSKAEQKAAVKAPTTKNMNDVWRGLSWWEKKLLKDGQEPDRDVREALLWASLAILKAGPVESFDVIGDELHVQPKDASTVHHSFRLKKDQVGTAKDIVEKIKKAAGDCILFENEKGEMRAKKLLEHLKKCLA